MKSVYRYNNSMPKICIFPRVEGTGGVASFRLKFEAGLKSRGIGVTNDPDDASDALLVLAGTRNLLPLWRAKRRGTRIVQRLDGVNWVQTRPLDWTPLPRSRGIRQRHAGVHPQQISRIGSFIRVSSLANGGRIGTARHASRLRSSSTVRTCRCTLPMACTNAPRTASASFCWRAISKAGWTVDSFTRLHWQKKYLKSNAWRSWSWAAWMKRRKRKSHAQAKCP